MVGRGDDPISNPAMARREACTYRPPLVVVVIIVVVVVPVGAAALAQRRRVCVVNFFLNRLDDLDAYRPRSALVLGLDGIRCGLAGIVLDSCGG